MKFNNMKLFCRSTFLAMAFSLLAACGGGGSDGGSNDGEGNAIDPSQMGGAIQEQALALTGTVSTFAGTPPDKDGAGTAATFNIPYGVVRNGAYLYVADMDNHKIRQVVIATGEVTTLAGSGSPGSADGTGTAASFNSPSGITTDGTSLYVADVDSHLIRQIVITSGEVTTLAGTGSAGSADGAGTAASFYNPFGVTTDGTNLYVVDTYNNKIRQVVIATGVVTTLAGSGNSGFADGTGTAASFNLPRGITTDGSNLYVADRNNHTIRQIVIATGVVTTLAGSGSAGSADGTGTAASFNYPSAITIDDTYTYLYIADSSNNNIRQVVITSSEVTTLAGSGSAGSADGTGAAASFYYPYGITTDGTYLYVADMYNNKIRQVVIATGEVTTLAGSGSSGAADGTGNAASFYHPDSITTDGINLYVADEWNNTIRQIVIASGVVTTLAGSGSSGAADGTGSAATFFGPSGITTDGTNLYVADRVNHNIRQVVIATGEVTTLAGSGSSGAADGTGTAASFYLPYGITTDGTNLYVADTGNHNIRQVVIATGVVTTFTGTGSSGSADGIGTAASFYRPDGITTDGTNLYVADTYNHKIRQIVIASGEVTTLAGSGSSGAADGIGTSASFYCPEGITSDGTNLYVVDRRNHKIRQVAIATGDVSTLAGSGGVGSTDGTGTIASFRGPYGVTTDGTVLYVADTYSNTIRRIQ